MTKLLSNIRIKTRIYLLILIVTLGMGAILWDSISILSGALYEQRNEQTRRLDETAQSLIAAAIKNVKEGKQDLASAQQAVMDQLKQVRYDDSEYFWIHDLDGKMVMHPLKPELDGKNILDIKDANGNRIFKEMNDVVEENNGAGSYTYYWPPDETAKMKISYVKLAPEWGWVVGTGVYVSDVEKQIALAAKNLAVTVAIVILVALCIAVFLGRSVSNPILKLNASMRNLADGDLSTEIGMQDRKDEIGQMAETVRVFQENAREVERLKAEQIEMGRRAEQEKKAAQAVLADTFEERVGHIVTVLTNTSKDLTSNSKNLSETAEQTSGQTATVAAAAEEASASVQTVASATEELSSSISEINRQVAESSRVAAQAVNEVHHTDQTVSTLSEAATQIGDVVKLIQDIAEQTNLLALNATIEAARAGEAGKGFAVVASEVKNLATQTGRATQEISEKIETVQVVSAEVVNAIRGIGGIIDQINDISKTIVVALGQQDAATREISSNVQQASAGISEVSSSIANVAHAAKTSSQAANAVLSSSGDVSQQSTSLREQINKFLESVRNG